MQRSLRSSPSTPALPGGFDPARLRRLLDLVGPEQAPGLLTQLRLDLSGCAADIPDAGARQDWDGLRRASHVLTSLAGSAGAMALHALAQELNDAAHARDPQALTALLPALTADLAALIALVQATPAEAPR
jgi:HPt (histidine-containing phosphotransfer) domain-containing protein